jgi:proteasome lid subunit RPN8/RPN11
MMELRTNPHPPPQSSAGSAPAYTAGAADTRLRLSAELRGQIARVVEVSYPFEACGLMLGHTADGQVTVERILHARNLNIGRLRDRYLLDPDDFLAADRVARDAGLEIVGIWHSHPDAPARPSSTDLERAWEGYSYLIVAVTTMKVMDFRSWRLKEGRFVEESIVEKQG